MRLFRDWVNGTQFTAETGFALTDARDVADIHALALSAGEPGQRYLVANENFTTRELGELIGTLTGYTPPHLPAGRRAAYLYGALSELWAKLSGSTPNLTRATARDTIGRYMFTDCSDTWRAFDTQPRPAEEMVRDAIRWLLTIGEIKDGRAAAFGHKFPPDPAWAKQ
jgi:nucleoside-diphosphate-sugar epimerase